jgi:5-methylcytosine-specific restriction endonuclease McrA
MPISHLTRFCSMECKNKAHTFRMVGEGNGRYVHGDHRRAYPPGWTQTHKRAIRERDGQVCRLCGMTREVHGKELPVHHIDYMKENLEPANLITVCRFCHGQMHGRPDSREEWRLRLSAITGASPMPPDLFTISV